MTPGSSPELTEQGATACCSFCAHERASMMSDGACVRMCVCVMVYDSISGGREWRWGLEVWRGGAGWERGKGWGFGRRRRAAGSKPATTIGGHGWSTGQLFYDQP